MSAKTTRIGVAWRKTTSQGTELISVVINNPIGPDFNFTLFPAEKQSEQSPDYVVTKQSDASRREAAAAQLTAKPKPVDDDEEQPF